MRALAWSLLDTFPYFKTHSTSRIWHSHNFWWYKAKNWNSRVLEIEFTAYWRSCEEENIQGLSQPSVPTQTIWGAEMRSDLLKMSRPIQAAIQGFQNKPWPEKVHSENPV